MIYKSVPQAYRTKKSHFMTHTLKNVQSWNFERKSAPGLFIRIFSKFAITYIETSSSRKDSRKYFQIITSGPGVNSMTHTLKNAQILNFERKSAPGLFIRIFSKFAITYIDTSSSRKDPKKYFQIITSGPGVNSMTHTVKTRFSNLKFSHKFYFSKIIFFTIILRIFQRSF